MSFILDALRKSEQQRPPERRSGLFPVPGPGAPGPRRRWGLYLLLGVMLVVAGAVGAWVGSPPRSSVVLPPPTSPGNGRIARDAVRPGEPDEPQSPTAARSPVAATPVAAVSGGPAATPVPQPAPTRPAGPVRPSPPPVTPVVAPVPPAEHPPAATISLPPPAPGFRGPGGAEAAAGAEADLAPGAGPTAPQSPAVADGPTAGGSGPPPSQGSPETEAPEPLPAGTEPAGAEPAAGAPPGSLPADPEPEPPVPPPDGRVLLPSELPAKVREGLPDLAVTGRVWSEDPSLRLLTLEGRILREGAEVAPGLRLERIEHDGAVFTWRGYRIRRPGP